MPAGDSDEVGAVLAVRRRAWLVIWSTMGAWCFAFAGICLPLHNRGDTGLAALAAGAIVVAAGASFIWFHRTLVVPLDEKLRDWR